MKRDLQILDECNCYPGGAKAFPLSIVVIYNDLPAALRAAQTLESLGNKFFGKVKQRLMPVPVAQLSDAACFDHLLSDAATADMIIVSLNGPSELPPVLKQWIEVCLGQRQAGNSAVVALLSSHEQVDAPDSPRYQFMKNATRAAGLDFFAPTAAQVGETGMSEPVEVFAGDETETSAKPNHQGHPPLAIPGTY